jgi:hypothetical protein
VPPYKHADVGAAFGEAQYMSGVSATDAADGNITSRVTHNSPVNTSIEGYYVVTYTVTNSNGNSVRGTTLVFVGKDWVFGPEYAVRAYDFSKRVGAVLGTNSEMISSARAQAVGINPAAADFGRSVAVAVTNDGGYPVRKVGSYHITFAPQAEISTAKTITATVAGGSAPTLTVPKTRRVPASGGSFNYMQGVSANDAEDGTLTSKVIHNSPVNMNMSGAYKVTYNVTDSDGNTTQKSGIVLVGTGWVVSGGYALYAEDFARKLSAVTGTSSEATRLAKAMAVYVSDASSTNFGRYVPTKITNLGGYKKAKGSYHITFAITEKTSVTKTIKATISDDTPRAPVTNVTNRTTNNNTTTRTTQAPAPSVTPAPAPNLTVNQPDIQMPEPIVVTVPAVAETIPEAPTPENPLVPEVPTFWSLINVLLVVASLILGFYLMIVAMRRKEEDDDAQTVHQSKQIRMWGQLGVILGIASVIVLLLTQHFDKPMQLIDTWAILFATIFGVELLAAFGVNSKKKEEWEKERTV